MTEKWNVISVYELSHKQYNTQLLSINLKRQYKVYTFIQSRWSCNEATASLHASHSTLDGSFVLFCFVFLFNFTFSLCLFSFKSILVDQIACEPS